jgi:glycosyltransferase Alg8
MPGLILMALMIAAGAFVVPDEWWEAASPEYLFAIGMIGFWRYGWGLLHLSRAMVYRHIVFPRMRRRVEALGDAALPSHVYLLITSFRIPIATTARVYRAAIEEAIRCGLPCTLIASIVDIGDERLITRLFESTAGHEKVRLIVVRVEGLGKRYALAEGFRAIARERHSPDSAVCVIDGDSLLESGILRSSLSFLKANPKVGAFTTDEVCEVEGARIFHDWYNLRFAQRQVLMSSMGLSRRVLTLTGRMSAFKAGIVCDPRFIAAIEEDCIHHWRFGQLKFLTGDDKSSWYYLLRNGFEMLYIPDVRIMTIEQPPHPNFLLASSQLMMRWFGNMLRTNGRALALGYRRTGLFTWWSILDQRISMWTSLTGLTAAVLVSIAGRPILLIGYIYWVAITRLSQTLLLLTVRRRVSWTYPFLLYYNQVYGSIIKTFIFFRLDRQKWTRQKTTLQNREQASEMFWIRLGSNAAHSFGLLLFLSTLGSAIGIFSIANTLLVIP